MTFKSYAQNFEDVVLWRALHDIGEGRYLDVGAQDPVVDSVSLAFYQAGWRGVHVEPAPAYAEKLRAARPDETIIQAAVSDEHAPIEFYEFVNTGLSTGKAAIAKRHAEAGFSHRKMVVPTITLFDLFDSGEGELHWLKIDVEGMEAEVLRSWGRAEVRPWIIVVEATSPLSQEASHANWIKELTSRDYEEVYFDGLSRYFLHQSQAGRRPSFQAPVNVFDRFAVTRQHFSASDLRRDLESLEEQVTQRQADAERLGAEVDLLRQRVSKEEERAASLTGIVSAAEKARDEARAEQLAILQSLADAERRHGEELERWQSDHRTLVRDHAVHVESIVATWEDRLGAARLDQSEQEAAFEATIVQLEEARASLNIAAAVLRRDLASAEQAITEALAVPPTGWQRLGSRLGFAGRDLVRFRLQSWKSQAAAIHDHSAEREMPAVYPPEAKFDCHVETLAELLSLDAKDFVRSAYQSTLGREADPEGEAYYLKRLGDGVPKLQVLDQMRKSPEAKLLPDPLPGLDEVLRDFRRSALLSGKSRAASAVAARVEVEATQANIRQFMQYFDEDFVRVLYRFFLGREPDGPGLENYVSQLRRGTSRQQVLVDVAHSREARKLGRRAIGQSRLEAAVAIDRIPLLRTFVAMCKFNFGVRSHLRDMRALQNHLYRFGRNAD
jgi:FkbM family methyltransferase